MKKQKRTARLPEPRWTEDEAKAVEASAKKLGISISAYLRQAALCYKPSDIAFRGPHQRTSSPQPSTS